MDATQIDQLCNPDCFPHSVDAISLIETHVSWVVLTGTFAYKVKKPVNFGFLDFSTLEKRALCCREELRLNGRSSDGLYISVVPVCSFDGRVAIEGGGDVIDYAVKMRQFDPDSLLSSLLLAGDVDVDDMDRLGYRIGAFHRAAAIAPPDSAWGDAAAINDPMLENFSQIVEQNIDDHDREVIESLKGIATSLFKCLLPEFEQRRKNGFIRELHGDLHAGNIARIDQLWVPFDCIEFNPNLRWIDAASDIAFLVMDLEYRGFQCHANRLLNAYLEYTADYDLLSVLIFYKFYRAMVRAKVALLRLQQARADQEKAALLSEFRGYLGYCVELKRHVPPFLVMMVGVSGSGKSTVSRRVSGQYGAIVLRSDAVRKNIFGMRPDESSPEEIRSDMYSEDASRRTFSVMESLTEKLLSKGYSVIVDATFIKHDTRTPFLLLSQRLDIPFVILYCTADRDELERRIRARESAGKDASEADSAVMQSQLRNLEPLTCDERMFAVDVVGDGWWGKLGDAVENVR